MDRKSFLKELYIALDRLPEEEKRNAMAYYNEYLDDAGPENEARALADLGPVREIAARINAEFAMKDMAEHPQSTAKGINAVLVVLLAIFTSPITVPIALCMLFGAACVLMVALGILCAIWGVAVSAVVGGLCFAIGIFFVATPLPTGVTVMGVGAGIAALGFGILFGLFCFWISKMLIRGVAYLFNSALKKNKKKTPGSENFVADQKDSSTEDSEEEYASEENFADSFEDEETKELWEAEEEKGEERNE